MHGWASEVPIFCATGYQKKEEVKDVGAYNYKMAINRGKGAGFDSQWQYPVAVARAKVV